MPYAENTTVSVERTVAEIQQTLKRYGATQFGFIDQGARVSVGFEMKNRRVRFSVPLPAVEDSKRTPRGKLRSSREMLRANAVRQRERYRALLLVIKAKLESVASGIETFDEAFLAHLLLPNGQTVGEWSAPQIENVYAQGRMPALLPSGED